MKCWHQRCIYIYKEMVVNFDICNAMSCSRQRDAYIMTNDAMNVQLVISWVLWIWKISKQTWVDKNFYRYSYRFSINSSNAFKNSICLHMKSFTLLHKEFIYHIRQYNYGKKYASGIFFSFILRDILTNNRDLYQIILKD